MLIKEQSNATPPRHHAAMQTHLSHNHRALVPMTVGTCFGRGCLGRESQGFCLLQNQCLGTVYGLRTVRHECCTDLVAHDSSPCTTDSRHTYGAGKGEDGRGRGGEMKEGEEERKRGKEGMERKEAGTFDSTRGTQSIITVA